MVWHRIRVVLIAIMIAISAGCAKDVVTGKSTLNVYSLNDDVKIGTMVIRTQIKSLKENKKNVDSKQNKKQLQRIRKIVKNLAAVSHYPDFPYEAHLADLDVVNAWCAPGGKIMVYEGLWDPKKGLVNKKSDDEIAAVLAHEMAHATARHVTERLSQAYTLLAVGSVAQAAIGATSSVGADMFGTFFFEGVNVYLPAYSRTSELEADRLGLFYMAKAGYDPRAAVKLWTRAAKEKGNKTDLYASHPSNGERANQLKKYLPKAIEYYEETKAAKKSKKNK